MRQTYRQICKLIVIKSGNRKKNGKDDDVEGNKQMKRYRIVSA